MMINTYQNQLQEYLQASSLTPGMYAPSSITRSIEHVAVCVDGKPLLLTGPSGDQESLEQANAFCSSQAFHMAIEAVVKSESGIIERGSEDGTLMTINLSQNRGLTTLLCINSELAKIIDPGAPEMCEGQTMLTFASQSVGTLEFH